MVDPATDPPSSTTLAPLLARLDAFTAFVRRRTGDGELAAEVVQESLAKAVTASTALRDEQRIVPWFWQIVRNTLADALARRRRLEPLPTLQSTDAIATEMICACLNAALDGLPERQRAAIQMIDIDGLDPDEAADELGITPINLKVIRHRGRTELRRRLEAVCRDCAERACRDCDCPPRGADHDGSRAGTPPPGK